MAEAVYLLCALTALMCAALLARGYFRNQTKLLMWSSICFLCIAASNIILVVDLIFVPGIDLSSARFLLSGGGVLILVHGLIWEVV